MSAADKIKAAAEKATGKAKEAIGHATDNEKLVAEGQTDQVKGEGRDTVEDIKDAFKH